MSASVYSCYSEKDEDMKLPAEFTYFSYPCVLRFPQASPSRPFHSSMSLSMSVSLSPRTVLFLLTFSPVSLSPRVCSFPLHAHLSFMRASRGPREPFASGMFTSMFPGSLSVRELMRLQVCMLRCGLRARSSAAERSSTMAAETQR